MKKVNNLMWLIGLIIVVVVALGVVNKTKKQIGTYEECVKAGGVILESYPEQCHVEGRNFTNPNQKTPLL